MKKGAEMKGVVFTEYMEFIEEQFGFDTVDEMIEKSGVSGVYTQAGNYEFSELFAMVSALAEITSKPLGFLVEAFAKNLFPKLVTIYPKPVQNYNNTFDFIAHVDDVVHPEVKKLYPDTELPEFKLVSRTENELVTIYISAKPLMDLARGLMIGCATHYKEELDVQYEMLPKIDATFRAKFTLRKI
jgi:hypothetical protein